VLVGRATVKMDDPELTVRMGVEGRNPTRVIFDSGLHLDPASKVALTAAEVPTWVLHAPDVDAAREPALEALRVRLFDSKGDWAGSTRRGAVFLRKQGLHPYVDGGPTVHGTLLRIVSRTGSDLHRASARRRHHSRPARGAGCPTLEDAVGSDVRARVSPRGLTS
jgi:riboflavin biosynthesis pyrimidine reductase